MKIAVKLIALLMLTVLIAGGCSYYHRATIQGFVEDADSEAGINSATVRFYIERPESAADDVFFARTSTSTSGSEAGFYSNTVIWDNYFSAFGAEGDSGTVYLGVTHPDYLARVVEVPGVLSDDVNTVETIRLQRVTFAAGEVFGRVVRDGDSGGENGVRVVLHIGEGSSAEEYVALTGDRAGESGWYSFDEPSWRDESTEPGGTSEITADIEIDDPDWRREPDEVRALTLASGQDREVSTNIRVVRKPRSEFEAVLAGQVFYRPGVDDEYRGLGGVEVEVGFDADTDPGGARSFLTETATDGSFTLQLNWRRDESYSPPANTPAGEDVLRQSEGAEDFDNLTVTYRHSKIADDPNLNGQQDRERIRTWINPNRMEDVYVESGQ